MLAAAMAMQILVNTTGITMKFVLRRSIVFLLYFREHLSTNRMVAFTSILG